MTDIMAIDEYVERFQENPRLYLDRLLTTIEINKVEALYQRDNQPPIFRKQFDELGLVTDFSINPQYHNIVPLPVTEFSDEDYQRLTSRMVGEDFSKLNEDDIRFYEGLELMLIIGRVEDLYLSRIPDDVFFNKRIFISKTYDEDGFPIAYQLNANVKRMNN